MRIYRCLCTKASKKTFVDFAFTPQKDPRKVTFEPSTEDELSHADLFRLRQRENPKLKAYLPPLFLYDDRGNISVAGAKELSEKDILRLKKFESTIKAFYQKFIHQHPDQKNSLSGHIVDEKNLRLAGRVNSPQAAKLLAEAQQDAYIKAKKNGTFDARFIDLPPQR